MIVFEHDKKDDEGRLLPIVQENFEKFSKEYGSQNSWELDDLLEHVEIYRTENGIAGSRVQITDFSGVVSPYCYAYDNYVAEADVFVYVEKVSALFPTDERECIDRYFSNWHMQNVFFVVNQNTVLDSEELIDVKKYVRRKLRNVFTDEAGQFDEELYRKRVFYINVSAAYNIRLNREVFRYGHKVLIQEETTRILEFEKHLYDYIGCERLCKGK